MAETLKEKTAKGLFWGFVNNSSSQLLNLALGIFLARSLVPADYGIVGVLAIFTAVAVIFQNSGFLQGLVNLKEPQDNDYNAVFWFNILAGGIMYAILFFSAPLIAMFFHQFQDNPIVASIFRGIRPAVVALIAVPTFKLAKSAQLTWATIWIPVACALLIWALGVSPIFIILAAGIGGWLYGNLIKPTE